MSSIASGTVSTTRSTLCFRKIPKSATVLSMLHRSSSSSPRMLLLLSSSSANSAKLLNSNNGLLISSSPKPFRPVMQWQDVTVKMVVDAPASVAYKLYADREMFPKWMPFLSSVEAMEGSPDLSRYLVKLESFGQNIEYHFLAKIYSQFQIERYIGDLSKALKIGSVRFFPRGPSSCLVEISFSYEVPNAFAPVAFAMKPFMEKIIRGGLERFAAFVKTI
ncbi:putative coenzyme Q-binding protein COQ10, START [Arabidopsis thaliana]